jgi:hypothetical protein
VIWARTPQQESYRLFLIGTDIRSGRPEFSAIPVRFDSSIVIGSEVVPVLLVKFFDRIAVVIVTTRDPFPKTISPPTLLTIITCAISRHDRDNYVANHMIWRADCGTNPLGLGNEEAGQRETQKHFGKK